MADSVIGALSVKITADTDGLKTGIKASGDAVVIAGKQLRKGINDFGKWATAGVLATSAIGGAMVKMNLTAIRELKNLALAADENVASFQRGAFAAKKFGIEQEKYGDILKDVNDRVGDFLISGAGPMTDFFEQIAPKVGITADAFKGLSGQESLGLYVKSLQDANVSQQEMTFFMEAIASDSTMLVPLFKDNAKQLKEMSAHAESLGVGLSNIDVAKAELASRQLDDSAAHIDALTKTATVELAPILVAVSKLFADTANNAGNAGTLIQDAIGGATTVVGVFADGLHGVHIIFKTLEIAALGFSALAVKVFQGITNTIATSIDGWVMMVNEAIKAINSIYDTGIEEIPSVRSSEFVKSVNEVAANMVDLVGETNAELHNLATQPLPSDEIKKFVENAKVEFNEMAAVLSKSLTPKKSEDEEGGSGVGTKKSSEIGFIEAETIGILEALNLRFMSQEEAELGHLQRQKEMQNAFLAEGKITAKEHADEMVRIRQAEEETKRAITLSNVQEGFAVLLSKSKTAQKAMQKIAIVNAVIKGKEAAVSAWNAGMSTGGPWAPLVAAGYATASIAKTGSMIASIRSGGSSMGGSGGGGSIPGGATGGSGGDGSISGGATGGSGGGGSIPGGATGGSTGGSTGGQTSQAPQQVQQPQRNIDVRFTGSAAITAMVRDEIIPALNEAAGDGVNMNFVGE